MRRTATSTTCRRSVRAITSTSARRGPIIHARTRPRSSSTIAARFADTLRVMRWLVIVLFAVACGEDLGPLDVEVETGIVHGADDGNGVKSWLGIPYAAPPVGP